MDRCGEGDNLLIVCAIARGLGQSVQSEHPQRQVVVILPIAIGASGVFFPDTQTAAERVLIGRAGEARFTVAGRSKDVMYRLREICGESEVSRARRLFVECEEVQDAEGVGPEIATAVSTGSLGCRGCPRKVRIHVPSPA